MSDAAAWPARISGIVESVVTTPQPGGGWNVAALGLIGNADHEPTEPVAARTWGLTRTRKNLERTGTGHVQFVTDAVVFTNAALDRWVREEAVLPRAAASVEITATKIATGEANGAGWVEWALAPQRTVVRRREVPLPSRGFLAIVEMTIAASRLDVERYETDILLDRLDYFADVASRCGGPRERAAIDRIDELTGWTRRQSTDSHNGREHVER